MWGREVRRSGVLPSSAMEMFPFWGAEEFVWRNVTGLQEKENGKSISRHVGFG